MQILVTPSAATLDAGSANTAEVMFRKRSAPTGQSLAVALGLGGALFMTLLLLVIGPGGTDAWRIGVLACAVGAIAGLAAGAAYVITTHGRAQALRRLVVHVEALARAETRPSSHRLASDLVALTRAIERAVATTRQRADLLVSQKRELEVQLRISEAQRQHVEAILNALNDGVIVTDAFNELAVSNESAARLLKFDPRHALRKPVDQVINDPVLVKLIGDTREAGAASLRRHVEHRMALDNGMGTFDVTLACIMNHQQSPPEPSGVVTILRDITRDKEIAEMKSDFVSSVSHELRTPLSSIRAYIEMLLDGEASDEQTRTEFYNVIQGETTRLSRLIDNILNISRIESGVVKVQREPIELAKVVSEAVEFMRPQARAKAIELRQTATPMYCQVLADRDMIYQAVINLVSNAVKYTPNDGRVVVSLDIADTSRVISVSVTDTGPGIPAEALPHLFEKFYRVSEHKKLAKGTGLGLNLVRQIVEVVHGGKVGVISTIDKGSTFTLSLPMAENI